MIRLWQYVKGVVNGWVRQIAVSSADPALDITQDGSGPGLRVKGAIQPAVDGGVDLGDSTHRFYRAYLTELYSYYSNLSVMTQLLAIAQSAASNPIKAKGAASQTGDLYQARDSSDAVLWAVEKDGDLRGTGGFKQPFLFKQDNCAAAQSAVPIEVAGQPNLTEVVMPFAGSVVGISVRSTEARTGGSLTVDATINGTATGLQATLDVTNTQSHYASQAKDTDAFNAGDRLGVKITTSADWAPTTADIVVCVIVEM